MIDETLKPRDILKRVTAVDDSFTGGGLGGYLRGVYYYLFGLKRKIPHARMAQELDAIAAAIRDQNLAVYPKTLAKLARIAAYCGDQRPEDTEICVAALNAIEKAMEWPIRDFINPGAVTAPLEGIIGMYESMHNAELVARIKRTLRAVEQRRVLRKPNTRKL